MFTVQELKMGKRKTRDSADTDIILKKPKHKKFNSDEEDDTLFTAYSEGMDGK